MGLFAGAQSRLNDSRGQAPGGNRPPENSQAVCQSRDCVLASASILQSVDEGVQPCQDFYQFAAGGWLRNPDHRIPDDAGAFGAGQLVTVRNRRIILDVLANADAQEKVLLQSEGHEDRTDARNLAKLKSFYNTCVDTEAQDKLGSKPLLELIREIQGKLRSKANARDTFMIQSSRTGPLPPPSNAPRPLPPSKSPGREPKPHPPSGDPIPPPPPAGPRQAILTNALSWAHSRGLSAFWDMTVDGDPIKDPSEGTAYLYPGGLGLPEREYYDDQSELAFYNQIVEQGLRAVEQEERSFGDSVMRKKPSRKIQHLAHDIVELEREIARFTPAGDVLADPVATYNPVSVNRLGEYFAGVNWPDYLSALSVRVPKKAIVTSPDFFRRLDELLSRTRDEVIEAYLVWTVIRTHGNALGPRASLRAPAQALHRHILGVDLNAKEDREIACLQAVDESLGFMAGRYFIREAFSREARTKVESIIASIISAFKRRLPELEWLDEKTREAAQVKADKIRIKVGWPDSPNTTDATSIANYYAPLDVQDGDHFGNQLRATTLSTRRALAQIGRKLDPLRWDMVPQEVNAYYNPGGAEIVFPAGILQAPYFDLAWPNYLQWGAFGAVSGHELSHAFDPTGRLYDENGYLRDWWTEETAREFTKRQKCLEYQYGNLTLDDGTGKKLPLNPKLTIGEDVADAGGVAQSFGAWQAMAEASSQSHDPLLPGLDKYTREQLFFIAYGISYARATRPAEALRRIRTDPHSPNPYRVNAVLTNFEPFQRAFGCKAGDAMFTAEKGRCQIW